LLIFNKSKYERQNNVSYFPENNTEALSDNDIEVPFEKKAECAKLIPSLEARSKDLRSYLIEVFYSPKRDSCLFITESRDKNANLSTRSFRDALTGENIKFDTYYFYSGNNITEDERMSNNQQEQEILDFDRLINSYR
jgi:hypothetical protein